MMIEKPRFSLTWFDNLLAFNNTKPKRPSINNTNEILTTTVKYDDLSLLFANLSSAVANWILFGAKLKFFYGLNAITKLTVKKNLW